jgi:hypothetical protein
MSSHRILNSRVASGTAPGLEVKGANGLNNGGEDYGNIIGGYRQTLQQLLEALQGENLTAMLTHEVTSIA